MAVPKSARIGLSFVSCTFLDSTFTSPSFPPPLCKIVGATSSWLPRARGRGLPKVEILTSRTVPLLMLPTYFYNIIQHFWSLSSPPDVSHRPPALLGRNGGCRFGRQPHHQDTFSMSRSCCRVVLSVCKHLWAVSRLLHYIC